MRLYDWAQVIRSKNAGPFTLTIDLVFADQAQMERVLTADSFTPARIAGLYGVDATSVRIVPFPAIRTIKVTMPRPDGSSGAPDDRDVYGCQQHFPLADLEVDPGSGQPERV
ncbi:MAG: DUF4387 domain-containing protein [Candidatus Anammoximicrobium sp.]|nr:DUF4387 domain-containing protein [Candidatus Anammoximicrobium sp.]